MKLPIPVICECGFATMDTGEAVRHAEKHERETVWECLSCGTTFKEQDGEHKDGYLVCPSCWDEDIRVVYPEGAQCR